MKKDQTYKCLVQTGRDYIAIDKEVATPTKLKPGAYRFEYNRRDDIKKFIEFTPKSDEILDIPSKEYQRILKEMQYFLSKECQDKFKQLGFLSKRSALLHGLPGTGKSVLTGRVIKEVISNGGLVLFSTNPNDISVAYDILDDLQPETLVLNVLEEIDGIIKNYGDQSLLSILDGEIQKENVMYLATTNHLDRIPARILRPGRISSVIEIKYPDEEGRTFYFNKKMGNILNQDEIKTWSKACDGLSIDELKEVVQSVYIFNNSLKDTVDRIKALKNGKSYQEPGSDGGDSDFELKMTGGTYGYDLAIPAYKLT